MLDTPTHIQITENISKPVSCFFGSVVSFFPYFLSFFPSFFLCVSVQWYRNSRQNFRRLEFYYFIFLTGLFLSYLLTPWSRVLLEKLTGFAANQSRNSPHFMEPESSSPYSQASVTCPYPEPTPSSPHNHFPS